MKNSRLIVVMKSIGVLNARMAMRALDDSLS
jgi:hypothetical protein